MPELPEVETVVRGLNQKAKGITISGIGHVAKHLLKREPKLRSLKGDMFTLFHRRGKYIIAELKSGRKLLMHLRMSGRLLVAGSDFKADKHVHFEATFSKSNKRLVFRDMRKFGILQFMNGEAIATLAKLGVEAPAVSAKELFDRTQKSRRPIKSFLLDQNAIAGIGNIYADESLYLAGIHPQRLTSSVTYTEAQRLARSIRLVMKQAIFHMGTTFDGFRGVNGDSGKHARYLRVYHQTGKKCRRCGRTIVKIKLAGRGTHYCPGCQKI